jgi:hypothetical protein
MRLTLRIQTMLRHALDYEKMALVTAKVYAAVKGADALKTSGDYQVLGVGLRVTINTKS